MMSGSRGELGGGQLHKDIVQRLPQGDAALEPHRAPRAGQVCFTNFLILIKQEAGRHSASSTNL